MPSPRRRGDGERASLTGLRGVRPPLRRRGPPRTIHVLAADLDRTLVAPRARPGTGARTALREARALGLHTLLASGRTHASVREFARLLGEVDGIVAENGAVVEVPLGAPPIVRGSTTAARVRARLRLRGALRAEVGTVVVSLPRSSRAAAALRGLPVHLVPNVDRVMVLPRGVTKGAGVATALARLGVPAGEYAAIGDAENDLDLLRGAALAGAVGNAEPRVRAVADYVARGRYARGVLEFVRGPIARRVAATAERGHR